MLRQAHMIHLETAAMLALSVGSVAFTVSLAKISRPPRMWLAARTGKFSVWCFGLVSCPFCVAVWLSLAATAVYRPWLVTTWRPLDFMVTALAMAAAAMLPVLVIKKAVTP